MISENLTNLSDAKRRELLNRAIYTEPFFYFFEFLMSAKGARQKEFGKTSKVDKDFYVTELMSNFSDVENIGTTEFLLSVYTAQTDKSLYQYYKSFLLPSSFQTTEARFNTAYGNQKYVDRQSEIMPYKIFKGNSLVVNLVNQAAITDNVTGRVMVKGYYINPNTFLTTDTIRGINESLAQTAKTEIFLPNIGDQQFIPPISGTASTNYNFQNDRFARLALGFQIQDLTADLGAMTNAKIRIFDTKRNLKFSDAPIPLEFFAPRQTAVRDTNIYYLPMEFLWQPFSNLRIEVITETAGADYQLSLVTRLV